MASEPALPGSACPLARRALRAVNQKSNRPKTQFQNNSEANSPANPPLIKIRCAKMITAAHHPVSLTEEQRMGNRHEGIEARRHEVVSKAKRDQGRDDARPHSPPLRLAPTPCLRASVPPCLCAYMPSPPCPKMSPNVPIYKTHFAPIQ